MHLTGVYAWVALYLFNKTLALGVSTVPASNRKPRSEHLWTAKPTTHAERSTPLTGISTPLTIISDILHQRPVSADVDDYMETEEYVLHEDFDNSTSSEHGLHGDRNSTGLEDRLLSYRYSRTEAAAVSSNYGKGSAVNKPYWVGEVEKWNLLQGLGYDADSQWGVWQTFPDQTVHGHASCTAHNWPFWCSFYKRQTPSPYKEMKFVFMERKIPVARKWLCSASGLFSGSGPRCYCDKECILFGDCCVDAFNTTLGLRDYSDSITDVLKEPEKLYEEISHPSLEASYLSLYHLYGSCHHLNVNGDEITVSVIAKCPERNPIGVDPIYRQKCENASQNVLNSIPVTLTFSARWQVVFLNIFCAFCHGLEKDDIELWDVYAKCLGEVNLTLAAFEEVGRFVDNSCTRIYTPPKHTGQLRLCFMETEFKSECTVSSNNTTDRIACPAYIAPVWYYGESYKNIHCAYCDERDSYSKIFNGGPIPIVETMSMAKHPQQGIAQNAHVPFAKPGLIPTAHPPLIMKVLFDFSFQAGLSFMVDGSSKHGSASRCNADSVYDFSSGSCKTVICPPGSEWIDGLCQHRTMRFIEEKHLLPTSNSKDYDFMLSVTSHVSDKNNANETLLTKSYRVKLEELLAKYSCRTCEQTSVVAKVKDGTTIQTLQDDNITFVSKLQIRSENDQDLHNLIEIVAKFVRLISRNSMGQTVEVLNVSLANRNVNKEFECPKERYLKHAKEMSFEMINDTVYFVDNKTNIANRARNTIFSLGFMSDSDTPIVQDVAFCSNLLCPQIEVSSAEYTFENETLLVLESRKRLSREQYEIRNNSVYVCIPTGPSITTPVRTFQEMPGALIIQTATYSLSIIALVLTIFIYIRYMSLRTLHGKTLISLSVSLIGGQLTGLLPIPSGTLWCEVSAIIMHFSWLAAFGWMSMISFNMVTTFFGKQTTVANTHVDRKRYLAYSFIGWLLPGLIVISCIALDHMEVPKILQIGYGHGTDGCFISGKGMFIFFSLPHLISVMFNIIAFVLTVYGICRKRKVIPGRKMSKDRWFFLIYVKLSVVMGATWTVALLASFTHQLFLWYIHFFLNGLQGVFVFISFALRATIWRKIKIKKIRKPHSLTFQSKGTTFYSVSGNSASAI